MIPILYDKDETRFTSNGLGRLYDCTECIVTEEKNGSYECDFTYPVDGVHFDLIDVGKIIGVTHDDTEDVQPFDIVSYTKTIEGEISFHCVHISYRLSKMVANGRNITTVEGAFTRLSSAVPSGGFTYNTDITGTNTIPLFDGLPKTARTFLGGAEGSILDVFGGEYEWDKFNVYLHSSRGEQKPFKIRYGINMTEYKEEVNIQDSFNSVIPYFNSQDKKVIGSRVTATEDTVTERGECVALDVSEYFTDTIPTKAQVEAMGSTYMKNNHTWLPVTNFEVEFIRLQDLGLNEYELLESCRLCDTVGVEFPQYNTFGTFKVVKTEWDVLADRYKKMELGSPKMTLSQAMGIDSFGSNGSGSNSAVDEVSATASSGWTNYATADPVVRKAGKVVEFIWACKPTAKTNLGSTNVTVCTIPSGYRPSQTLSILCQGSGSSIFLLTINASGNVSLSRLRDMASSNSSYMNATTSMWFPLHATYITSE